MACAPILFLAHAPAFEVAVFGIREQLRILVAADLREVDGLQKALLSAEGQPVLTMTA